MASPVLSINAFGLFELHVSCQDEEDGAGWRRWGLYPHLLVLSAAWETHRQELQHGNFAPFSGDLLTSLEPTIYLRPTGCYPTPALHSLISLLDITFRSMNLQKPLEAAARPCRLLRAPNVSSPLLPLASPCQGQHAQHHHHKQKKCKHQFPQTSREALRLFAPGSTD